MDVAGKCEEVVLALGMLRDYRESLSAIEEEVKASCPHEFETDWTKTAALRRGKGGGDFTTGCGSNEYIETCPHCGTSKEVYRRSEYDD